MELGRNGCEDRRQEKPVAKNLEEEDNGLMRRKKCQCGGAKLVWASPGAVDDSQELPMPCAKVLVSLSSHASLLAPEMRTTLDQ